MRKQSYCNTLPTIDETLEICCCNTEQKTKGIIFLCSLQSKNISIVTTESGVILLPILQEVLLKKVLQYFINKGITFVNTLQTIVNKVESKRHYFVMQLWK